MRKLILLAAVSCFLTPAMAVTYQCPSVAEMQQAQRNAGNAGQFNVVSQGFRFLVYNQPSAITGLKNIRGIEGANSFQLICDYSTTAPQVDVRANVVLTGNNCAVTDPGQGSSGTNLVTYNCNDPAVCPVVCGTTLNPNKTKSGFDLENKMKNHSKGMSGDIDIKTAE